jgi:hypothetical protein
VNEPIQGARLRLGHGWPLRAGAPASCKSDQRPPSVPNRLHGAPTRSVSYRFALAALRPSAPASPCRRRTAPAGRGSARCASPCGGGFARLVLKATRGTGIMSPFHTMIRRNSSRSTLLFPRYSSAVICPPFPLLPLSIREGGRTPLAVGRFLRKQTHHNTGVTRGPAFGTREGATLGPPQARNAGEIR